MSLHLYCYSDMSTSEVDAMIASLINKYPFLFSTKFLIYISSDADEIPKQVALEYGFNATSYFLIRYNDKEALDLAPMVESLIKETFGEPHILLLFQNNTLR